MKTISDLAAGYIQSVIGAANRDTATHVIAGFERFAKQQGYTITITPPPTVATWRLEMQRICRVLLDIDTVDASGLTEHEYAHNAKLRKLWQDKADAHRAAYPGNPTPQPVSTGFTDRERAIMREGIANGLIQAKNGGTTPKNGWYDASIDQLLARMQSC